METSIQEIAQDSWTVFIIRRSDLESGKVGQANTKLVYRRSLGKNWDAELIIDERVHGRFYEGKLRIMYQDHTIYDEEFETTRWSSASSEGRELRNYADTLS